MMNNMQFFTKTTKENKTTDKLNLNYYEEFILKSYNT
jgi:hypothetical protein